MLLQDVEDVLTAIDYLADKKIANPSKIAVVGISHGGFLATHLIGQVDCLLRFSYVPKNSCKIELDEFSFLIVVSGTRKICSSSSEEPCVQSCFDGRDNWYF